MRRRIDVETTSCVYGVSVKCSTYGFIPAKCVRNLHLFLKYHFPTVAFGTFCIWKSVWSWFPFCADVLLKIYNHHRIPLKKYIWFHYQPERVTSILVITLSRTCLWLCRVHRMYPCACYASTRVSENEFRKTNNSACTNCSNLFRQM